MFLEGTNKTVKAIIEYILYVFIASFPFLIYQGFLSYGTSTRSINLIIISGLSAIVIGIYLFFDKTKLSVTISPITLSLFIFLGISIWSSLHGVDFANSFWSKSTRTTGLFYFIHLIFFYLLLTVFFFDEVKFRRFIKVFIISATIFSISSLLSGEGLGLIFSSQNWQGFTFCNSTFAGMYLYSAFVLSSYYASSQVSERRLYWKFFLPVLLFLNPYFINTDLWFGRINIFKDPLAILGSAQASAYTAIISAFAILFFCLVLKIKSISARKYILLVSISIGTILLSLVSFSLVSKDGYIQKLYLSQAGSARPMVWEVAKKSIDEHPWLGWGVDNFDRVFEANYDNRLLELKNGGEAWFDRAHNVFIDQSVETGYVGLISYILIYLILISCLTYVLIKSKEKKYSQLSIILIVYFLGHLLELQTAFETTISYLPFILIVAVSAVIFHKTIQDNFKIKTEWEFNIVGRYLLATLLVIGFGYLFVIGTIPVIRAQIANYSVRVVGDSAKRLPIYPTVFASPIDRATVIWRSSYDLQRGILSTPAIMGDQVKKANLSKEFEVFLAEYDKYLLKHPTEYRSRIQLASTYIFQRLFEINNLEKAHRVLDEAITLVPTAPQAYWMKAVTYLYQRKFTEAKAFAKKAYDLNPNIEESQRLLDYVNKSIKTFPEIDFYSFRQI